MCSMIENKSEGRGLSLAGIKGTHIEEELVKAAPNQQLNVCLQHLGGYSEGR